MVDQNCAYCVEGELLAKFGIKICELENSKVYLFKEQSHPGRVVVAHKKHVSEILELTPQERAAYLEEIAKVSEAIHKIFKPAKVNYGAYGIQDIICISILYQNTQMSMSGVAHLR